MGEVAKKHGISDQTSYAWHKRLRRCRRGLQARAVTIVRRGELGASMPK